jgi:hypothetical protein
VREETRPEGGVLLVREHRASFGRELEAVVTDRRENARGTLLEQPLAQPALVEPRLGGQVSARDRSRRGEHRIQPEAIAEMDHARRHRAAERPEHVLRVVLQLVGVERSGLGHAGLRRAADPQRWPSG